MQNLNAFRGDDFGLNLSFGTDITGWTISFTLKKNINDADANAVIQKDISTHYDAVGGLTKIQLSNTETQELEGNYYYDLQYKDNVGLVKTFVFGLINFQKDVTRRV